MKIGTFAVTAQKFKLPCVYEYIRHDGIVLYVGFSRMMQRAFRSYGNRIGETRRFKAFSEAEAVRVTVFDTIEEAQAEERRLIVLHQPAANINFKYVQPTVTKPL